MQGEGTHAVRPGLLVQRQREENVGRLRLAMGPLQYQKHLRLQEARRLMLSGSMDATTAALEVSYQSPSQFSREYRRLFGLPPLQDIKAVRNSSASAGAFVKKTINSPLPAHNLASSLSLNG
jgi:AraC-like DNA-binding protein